jgi:tRNA pseudouridine13 synthase
MGVRPPEIGLAGLKDARAVTRQWMRLEHADPDRLNAFRDKQVRIERITRHGNKLRPGHLKANRFVVRIRHLDTGLEEAAGSAEAILAVLRRRGVPNYFGKQRFGARGDTPALGRALLRGDLEEFVRLLLGDPHPEDPPDCRAARDAFEARQYARALQRWPRHYADQRKALSAYKRKENPRQAVAAVDKRMRRLFVSAAQSAVFNAVLAARIDSIDRILTGDWAQKTGGGVFLVEDAQAEQPRAEAFEISPTGPLPGTRCKPADGEPGRIEADAIASTGMAPDDFAKAGSLKVKGARRPLRFALGEPTLTAGSDEHGAYLEVAFSAPSGCYATVALRELTKTDDDAETP